MKDEQTHVYIIWRDGSGECIASFQHHNDAIRFVDRYKWEDRYSSKPDQFGPAFSVIKGVEIIHYKKIK